MERVDPKVNDPPENESSQEEEYKRALAEAEARWKHENETLRQASSIRALRHKGKASPWDVGRKGKSHWDHLLEEMTWLSKEFARERRWKILQARKFANAVQRSKLDVESRVAAREHDEEKAIRKRAAWIAKEVATFWLKANRVVAFKVRTLLEAKKKEIMDRQLDALLGQTQRYSSLLAQRLTAAAAAAAAVNTNIPANGVGAGPSKIQTTDSEEAESEGYRSGMDDDADDEATLEEEDRLALEEGRNVDLDGREEAVGLAADAELPIEELLARYGHATSADVHEHPKGPEGKEVVAEDDEEGAIHRSDSRDDFHGLFENSDSDKGGGVGGKEAASANIYAIQRPSSRLAGEVAEVWDTQVPVSLRAEEGGGAVSAGGPSRANKRQRLVQGSGEPDSEEAESEGYRSGMDDDADDEATLEEEDRLALEEGRNVDLDGREEAVGLAADAELPIEELLARYGHATSADVHEHPKGPEGKEVVAEDDEEGDAFAGAMRAMEDVQPTGNTLATATVKTQVPFLLKGQLREYQLIGLDWLVTLYHRRLNGILADEMGLGKTIQTIALLAWLAAERGDWGPHLVVVPTSVMLNWEMEFKRWCPAFKLLTYFGSPKDRAAKRQGWSKPNAFHVCITSYTMILQDARMFRRKKWKYLILDEAHMIKNWKSQRWQTLLNFNSKRRLLITGTPLQNDLMELWSLMHFLMPQVFASHAQFKDWFSNPLTGMVEGSAEYNKAVVERLHTVLRPFLLRRLKKDVEKQLPAKHEHVVWCKLSKRQRLLYEEYMASRDTRATLASGNYLGIMNCLMQLRKVCNHPDLFEGRPIVSAFDAQPFEWRVPSAVLYGLDYGGSQQLPQELLLPGNSLGWAVDGMSGAADRSEAYRLSCRCDGSNMNISINACTNSDKEPSLLSSLRRTPSQHALSILTACFSTVIAKRNQRREQNIARIEALSRSRLTAQASVWLTTADCLRLRMCGMGGSRATADLVKLDLVKLPAQRAEEAGDLVKSFAFVIPRARVQGPPSVWCFHPDPSAVVRAADRCRRLQQLYEETGAILHAPILRSRLFFPDKRLIQYDCGKLQELAVLLGRLRSGGHRALIFTQMSRMLDVLESFLNLHAYTYVRLDGSTKPEMRQMLMQRFNTDPKIFCFILSTRSGGVGMNLTGADTVIFYDSDWNPAMDAQAQDRCHRIGQTREVNIYRLVSQHTIEENILRKSDQKRHLDWLAIQSGGFTTEAFFETPGEDRGEVEAAMRAAEDEGDRNAAAAAEKELAAEMDEFADGGVQTASELYIRGDKQSRSSGRGDGDGEDDNEEENEKEEENENEKSKSAQTDQKIETESQEKPSPITDEGFEDMAALATAGGQNSVASLETLQAALSPVERYAVRFVEEDKEGTGAAAALDPSAIEAMAAAMEATYKVEELDVDAIEAAEEEREAEIDEDEEVNVAVDWDQDGASAAYVKQLEAAEAEEREREAAWSTYYAAYAVADADANANANANVYVAEAGKTVDGMGDGGHRAVGEVPARGKRGRRSVISNSNNRTTTTISGEDVNLPVHEYEDNGNDDLKNVNRDVEFWRPNEDFVLCMIVSMLLQQGDTPSSLWWGIVSDALAAGAAATTVLSGRPAMMPTRFSPVSCQQRYEQLVAAYNFSRNQEAVVDSLCTTGLWDEVKQVLMHHCDHEALASMYHVLSRSDGDGDRQLLSMLHGLRAIEGQGIVKPNHILPPETVPEVEVVDRILSAVRAECGAGSARVIASRLPATIQAAKSQLVLPVFLGP